MKALLAAGLLAFALPCAAQPRLLNAKPVVQPLAGSLDAAVRQMADVAGAEAAWIAWAAPVVDGRSSMCCFNGDWDAGRTTGGRCRLEPGSSSTVINRCLLSDPEDLVVQVGKFFEVRGRRSRA